MHLVPIFSILLLLLAHAASESLTYVHPGLKHTKNGVIGKRNFIHSPEISLRGGVKALKTQNIVRSTASPAEGVEFRFNGSSSLTASTFNLAKNIIGGGMLALPAGMAAGSGTGYITAVFLMLTTCFISAYTFVLVGQSVEHTKATNFKDLWSKTIGPKSAWMVDAAIFALCFGVCIMYGCFLGDLLSSLASVLPSIPPIFASRTSAILGITSFVLLPLCLLKNLSALRYSSMIGIYAVLYVAGFIVKRQFDGTYAAGSGRFLKGLTDEFQPKQATNGLFSAGIGTFVLFNMLSTSFMAHPNAVKFYTELEKATPARFSLVVFAAFALAAAVYGIVMVCGYATFGQAASGLILNNYVKNDKLAIFGRLATAISIIGSQPLLFAGLRDCAFSTFSMLKLVPDDINSKPALWTALSVALLAASTAIAIVTPNVGIVVSLVGSLFGAGLVFSLPAFIYLHVLRQKKKLGAPSIGFGPIVLLHLIVLFGIIMTFVGTGLTIFDMKR